MGKSQRFSS